VGNSAVMNYVLKTNAVRKPGEISRFPALQARPDEGMTLVEIAIGVAVLGLVAAAAIAALMVLNKNAVSTRIMTNAREIVQRNIETAVAVPFTSTSIPTILAATASNGATWEDDGDGDNQETIYQSRDGSGPIVKGTLTRTVTAETNTPGADIRRVNFRLSYTLFGRAMSYEMTTIRATDK
jgi:prepilin-type N-terminal cleavage/methylation domain-containing protein